MFLKSQLYIKSTLILLFYSLTSITCERACSVSLGYACSQNPKCASFQYDYLSNTCIDCRVRSSTSSTCSWTNAQICQSYTESSTGTACVDCAASTLTTCTNSALAACKDYRSDGSSKCYNCSKVSNSRCLYAQVTGCANFAYDNVSLTCFDCLNPKNEAIWTNTKCYACFFSSGLTEASQDKLTCQIPTQHTYSFRALLTFSLTLIVASLFI